MGLTGVHDFDKRTCFQALQLLHERGELRLPRGQKYPARPASAGGGLGLRSGFGDDFLRIGSVKLFADGASVRIPGQCSIRMLTNRKIVVF